MGWYDWLLFLHVAAAFLFGMAIIAFWGAVVAGARPQGGDRGALANAISRPANVIVVAGSLGAVFFGGWLAIYVDGYELWDGWILASIVLWAAATELGRRAGLAYVGAAAPDAVDPAALQRRGFLLHATSSLAYLVILVLMVFKPGA